MGNRAKLNTQTQLTYNKVIAEKHTLDALIGFETEDYKYDYVYANGNTYPSYLPEIENAGNTRASSSVQRYRMTSFLGRLNYDYEINIISVPVSVVTEVHVYLEKADGVILVCIRFVENYQ